MSWWTFETRQIFVHWKCCTNFNNNLASHNSQLYLLSKNITGCVIWYLLRDTTMELGKLWLSGMGIIILYFMAWMWRIPRFCSKIGKSLQSAWMGVSNPSNLSNFKNRDHYDIFPLPAWFVDTKTCVTYIVNGIP